MFTNAQDALTFFTGGHAVFTLKSLKTEQHFTYRIDQPKDGIILFAKVLSNGDNTNWDNQTYLGHSNFASIAGCDVLQFVPGRKGQRGAALDALNWAFRRLTMTGNIPEDLEIRHEGRCCRCGRALTHPDSIDTGIGPECAKKMGA